MIDLRENQNKKSVTIELPYAKASVANLQCGQRVIFNGTMVTGRDLAHMKLLELMQKNEELPLSLDGQLIYYTGPCPAPPGKVIGSAGPTTSGRMDFATPQLLDNGLGGMLGKGKRSDQVVRAIVRNASPYFITYGGAGALLASRIKKVELIAFPELGPEAIYRFTVENFPAIVAIDIWGNDMYKLSAESGNVL